MFFNQLNNSKGYTGAGIAQPPKTEDSNLGAFVQQATTTGVFTEAEVIANLQSAYAIENPNLFNPESMDCVNCNISQAARVYLT